ncbi:adenylate/guanylate cyclase domain-containing protein [Brachybacterium sp. UNK5269]|uniref:adenylate/guanylate cyclase domain-containing protein n=1 Tax=Brachybacterium sp. UNK5269 TaxID=3408576 RepID=UPI003BB09D6F
MDGNFKLYNWVTSSARIKEILDQPAGAFEEVAGLPDRDKLTFTNGFYGYCSAIFIDIRDSSGLTSEHKRPTLAKIYRSFISEMVAVLNSDSNVREVNIVGDCVWASYKTTDVRHLNDVFDIVAQANTLLKLLNHHYRKKGISELRIGIGVDYGRVLMIKAGFNGSGVNDVVYMGDVVNRAAHLAHEAGRGWSSKTILVGDVFYSNLNEHNQGLLSSQWVNGLGSIYMGDVINTGMNEWIDNLS